jgi:hypothetical protein
MAGSTATQIVLIFSSMFVAITVAALWFTLTSLKTKNKHKLKEMRMEIIEKYFNEMIRIECPYCKTIYQTKEIECPNCKANTKKILFPKIPI